MLLILIIQLILNYKEEINKNILLRKLKSDKIINKYLNLDKMEYIPDNLIFKYNGNVTLYNLKEIPYKTVFDNNGLVLYLSIYIN